MTVLRNSITVKAYALGNVYEFTKDNLVENSVKVDKYCMTGETLSYGTAIASSFEFSYFEEEKIDWGTVDYVDYISNGVILFRGLVEDNMRVDDTRKVVCLDPLGSLDDVYTEVINDYVFDSPTVKADVALEKLLSYKMGELNTPTWTIRKNYVLNFNPTINKLTNDEIESCSVRDVVKWLLETMGLIVFAQGGSLIIKAPKVNASVLFDDTNIFDPLTISEHTMSLTGVSMIKEVTVQDEEGKDVIQDKEILSGDTLRSYDVIDNPFTLASATQEWTDTIYNRDKSLIWTPTNFPVEWEAGAELELLDVIDLFDREGNNYQTLVTSLSYTHGDTVLIESIGANWRKEKLTVGSKTVRQQKVKDKIYEKNLDVTFAKLDEQHKEFVENYQSEKQSIIDSVTEVTGTLEDSKNLLNQNKAELEVLKSNIADNKTLVESELQELNNELDSRTSDLSDKINTQISDSLVEFEKLNKDLIEIRSMSNTDLPLPPYIAGTIWYKPKFKVGDKYSDYFKVGANLPTVDEYANKGVWVCVTSRTNGTFQWSDWIRIVGDNQLEVDNTKKDILSIYNSLDTKAGTKDLKVVTDELDQVGLLLASVDDKTDGLETILNETKSTADGNNTIIAKITESVNGNVEVKGFAELKSSLNEISQTVGALNSAFDNLTIQGRNLISKSTGTEVTTGTKVFITTDYFDVDNATNYYFQDFDGGNESTIYWFNNSTQISTSAITTGIYTSPSTANRCKIKIKIKDGTNDFRYKFEKGDVGTEFTVSPYDIATPETISRIEQTLSKFSQQFSDIEVENNNINTKLGAVESTVQSHESKFTNVTKDLQARVLNTDFATYKDSVTEQLSVIGTIVPDETGSTISQKLNNLYRDSETFESKISKLEGDQKNVFYDFPIPPYEVGDIWYKKPFKVGDSYVINQNESVTVDEFANGGVWVCKVARLSGNFTFDDWERTSGDYSSLLDKQEARILQLSNEIDLRVISNELIGQINTQAGRVLIGAKDGTNENVLVIKPDTTLIDDATIKSAHISELDGDKIIANSIKGDKIVSNSITTNQLQAGTVTSEIIKAGSVLASNIASNAITSDKINANAVTADKVLVDSALINKLVTTSLLADKIWTNTISSKYMTSDFITSKVANIGGWSISSNAIHNGTGASYVGLWSSATGSPIRFIAGGNTVSDAPFQVWDSGFVKMTNAQVTGNITATSGNIANFKINGTVLEGGSGTDYVRLSAGGNGNIPLLIGGESYSTAPFWVSQTGTLHADGAVINGNITATSGKIGGLSIQNYTLESTGGSGTYFRLSGTDGYNPIQAGTSSSNIKFRVSSNGDVTASSITLTGGKVGGTTINSSSLSGGSWSSGKFTSGNFGGVGSFTSGSSLSGSVSGSMSGTVTANSSSTVRGNAYVKSGMTIGGETVTSANNGIRSTNLSCSTLYFSTLQSVATDSMGYRYSAKLSNGSWSITNSDIRLKENISELTNEYNQFIYDMPLIKYTYKNDENHTPRVGVNANYLMKTLPEYMAKSFLHQDKETGLYGANYEYLTPYLVKVVQEQNERIKKLEEKLNE